MSQREPREGDMFESERKSWSGKRDLNARPLPPEEHRPAQNAGFTGVSSRDEAGTRRESAGVAGLVTGTASNTELIAALNRAKVAFQLEALRRVMGV